MKVLLPLLLVSAVFAKYEEYKGWKSYYVEPSTQEQLITITSLVNKYDLDILKFPSVNRKGVVLVKPEYQELFTKKLHDLGVNYEFHCTDLKAALDADDEKIAQKEKENKARHGGRSLPYDNYQPVEVIDQYLKDIAAQYPDKVTLVNPGNSFEGHPMYYLKISSSNFANESKPIIFIEGGIHSREWISPPTVTWAIHKLVEDVTEPDLLDNFDWILFPMTNPDGYKVTFSGNRFWRKTRSTNTHVLSSVCPGVDGNRNFGHEFNTIGTSSNPCADNFPGNRAFSEIEVQYIDEIFKNNLNRMTMYLSMHSYGSMILYPWSHNGSLPSNALTLHIVGIAMADAINRMSHFEPYVVGNSATVIGYAAGGVSADYALSLGIPYSMIYELPGFGGGFQGFVVDPALIETIVKETWAGIVAGARRTRDFS